MIRLWATISVTSPQQKGIVTEMVCENHRIIGWKRPLRSSGPTVNPTPPCLLNHIPKCHIYTTALACLEHQQKIPPAVKQSLVDEYKPYVWWDIPIFTPSVLV